MVRFLILVFLVTILTACGNGQNNDGSSYCISPKIINGQLCDSADNPLVKLTLLDEEDNPKVCSGVMIGRTTALTASHCFDEFVFSASAEINGLSVKVLNVTPHPEATALASGEVRHDLALVELETEVLEANIVSKFAESKIQPGDSLEIYGFGQGDVDGPTGLLRRGTVVVGSVDEDFIRIAFDGVGLTTCFGDSGGPAFLVTPKGLELAGILTSGTNVLCGPGDVSSFVNLNNLSNRRFLESTGLSLY